MTQFTMTQVDDTSLTEEDAVGRTLSDLVRQHLPALASAWAVRLHTAEGTCYPHLQLETLQETVHHILEVGLIALRKSGRVPLEDFGRRLARLRWPTGFTLRDISTSYRLLRELLLALIDEQPWDATMRDQARQVCLTWVEETAMTMLVAFQKLTWQSEQRRAARLEGLNRLAIALSHSLSLDTVLQTAMEAACDLTGAEWCRIHLPDEERRTLRLKISLNSSPDLDEKFFSQPISSSLEGQAFSVGRLMMFEKQQDVEGARGEEVSSQAFACVPLSSKGQSCGIMSLGFSEENRFDEEDQALLSAIGHQVGMAIENAQFYEQERRQRQIAETLGEVAQVINSSLELNEVLDRVLVELEKVVPYDSASIMLLEGESARTAAARGFADHEAVMALVLPLADFPLTQRVIHQRQPLIIPDTQQEPLFDPSVPGSAPIQSVIAFPLISRNEVIGVLNVDSWTPHRYSMRDVEVVFRFAQYAAVTIANARLMKEVHQRADELAVRARQQRALLTIFPEISRELHLEILLQRIVEEAVTVIPGAQRGSILVRQADGFHFMGAVGYDLAGLRQMVLLPEHMAHFRISPYEIVCIRDISQWGRQHLPPETEDTFRASGAKEIKITLSAPIIIEGQVFGYLNLDNLESYDAFGPLAHEMVGPFAAQAAVAIANARQHGELEQKVRQRTQEIRHQRDRTAAILQSVADGVVVTDLAGNIVSTNPVADRWLYRDGGGEWTENQTLLSFIQHLTTHPPGKVSEVVEFLAWEQQLEDPCWQLTACDHKDCPAHGREAPPCWQLPAAYCHLAWESPLERFAAERFYDCPIKDKLERVSLQAQVAELEEGGKVQGLVIALRDISRLWALDRLKSQFVSTVSHELRTPLANIKLYHNLLKQGRDDRQGLYMEVMESEIVRLERLIQDILDLSRLEIQDRPARREAVDLNLLLQELIQIHALQAQNKGINLHVAEGPETLRVYADRNQLLQVFTNLLVNALNYTSEGGQIWLTNGTWHLQGEEWVETGTVPRPGSSVSRPPDGDWAVVSVRDTGVGILPEDFPRIFDRFYRGSQAILKTPGTGLGLPIVREILDLHGGHILVDSQPDIGSNFTVLLPLPQPEEEQKIAVLVADDEEQIGQVIHRFLSREGIEVQWVSDGHQALEAIAADPPDLLILDLAMPVMDGYQVLEKLQAERGGASLPVLVLSSWTEDKFQRVKRLGATDFLNKPFSGTVLVDVVKRLIAVSD